VDRYAFAAAREILLEKGSWDGELHLQTKDGKTVCVESRWTLLRDANDQPKSILTIDSDITERKQIEGQLLRIQRLEGIGALAGGIAHDLNNVLSPIIMSIDLLKLQHSDPMTVDVLETIECSARRGAEMVRQVLSFARGVEGQRLLVQPKHLLRDIQKIAAETFLKNVEVRTSAAPDLWTVSGDPTQLHQVLLNLCVNARDAMPGGGRITITAENISFDENYAAMNVESKPGPYVLLQVQDTGCGMTPDVLEKIFDPFFTTKELGKGTGLGLSTSMAIIKSHGGFVRVSSELHKGTLFKVYIPALGATQSGNGSEGARKAELPRGRGELVMVIDDEDAVRNVTSQTLQAFGYRTIMAADGTEAVRLYAKHQPEINAVLTDIMMPIMDGPATIQVLTKINPAVKIIAASGKHPNSQAANLDSTQVQHFLPKPYTAETLLNALQDLLHPQS
jgi:signal transduction histidine kinase/ActR/RegA family two-component response regulator